MLDTLSIFLCITSEHGFYSELECSVKCYNLYETMKCFIFHVINLKLLMNMKYNYMCSFNQNLLRCLKQKINERFDIVHVGTGLPWSRSSPVMCEVWWGGMCVCHSGGYAQEATGGEIFTEVQKISNVRTGVKKFSKPGQRWSKTPEPWQCFRNFQVKKK